MRNWSYVKIAFKRNCWKLAQNMFWMNLVWIYCRKVGDWGGNSRSGFWSWVNIFTGHFFLDHFCEFNGLEVVVVTKPMSLGRPWRLSSAKPWTLNNMVLASCPPGSSWIRRWKNCSLLSTCWSPRYSSVQTTDHWIISKIFFSYFHVARSLHCHQQGGLCGLAALYWALTDTLFTPSQVELVCLSVCLFLFVLRSILLCFKAFGDFAVSIL